MVLWTAFDLNISGGRHPGLDVELIGSFLRLAGSGHAQCQCLGNSTSHMHDGLVRTGSHCRSPGCRVTVIYTAQRIVFAKGKRDAGW